MDAFTDEIDDVRAPMAIAAQRDEREERAGVGPDGAATHGPVVGQVAPAPKGGLARVMEVACWVILTAAAACCVVFMAGIEREVGGMHAEMSAARAERAAATQTLEPTIRIPSPLPRELPRAPSPSTKAGRSHARR